MGYGVLPSMGFGHFKQPAPIEWKGGKRCRSCKAEMGAIGWSRQDDEAKMDSKMDIKAVYSTIASQVP